jgi:hypothetical protein
MRRSASGRLPSLRRPPTTTATPATATFSVTVSFDWSSLTTVTPAFTPTDVEIADVTGDGHLDAVVAGASSVALYAGDGTGARLRYRRPLR